MRRHGESRTLRTPEYACWVSMRQRCYNPKASGFDHYGGRGIHVCSRWKRSFEAFLKDMGRRPTPAHSIDRKDNDGDYTPKNCWWATKTQQNRNKSCNRVIQGKTITEWAELHGLLPQTLLGRLNRGMRFEAALTRRLRLVKKWEVKVGGKKQRAAAAAREAGIAAGTVYARLRRGWSARDALKISPGSYGIGRKRTVTITVEGKTRTVAEWADLAGVKENTLRERLRLHPDWPVERIVSKEFRPGSSSG